MSSTTVRTSRRSRLLTAADSLQENVHLETLAWLWLALVMVGSAALLLYLTRRTTFWVDEWAWITERRGDSLGTFLDPHNSHLSLVPVAIYKLLFATVGIAHYLPYRLTVTACHLVCVLLLYVYVKRRLGGFLALLGASVILLFGPGWQEFIWPFQIAWLIAIAAGIAALLMLDRGDARGDVMACLLIILSVASTSVGVAIAFGVAIEIGVTRRRLRDGWIVAIPLALYALWTVTYQHAQFAGDVSSTVGFVAQSAVIGIPALLGLSGVSVSNSTGTLLAFGAPLTAAAAAALIWAASRRRIWTTRALTLVATLVAFWILAGLGRSEISGPYATRYLYVDVVFVVLLAAELAQGVMLRLRTQLVLVLIAVAAVISNVGVLRDGAGFLRAEASDAKADIGALNLSRGLVPRGYVSTAFPGYPFVKLRVAQLFAAEDSLGSTGDSAAQVASAPDPARAVADAEMMNIRGLRLAPQATAPAPAAAPTVDSSSAGTTRRGSSCVSFSPTAAAAGQLNELALTIPRDGVWLTSSGAQASVGLRRVGSAFRTLGTLPPGTGAILRIAPDGLSASWHLQVSGPARARVCGVG